MGVRMVGVMQYQISHAASIHSCTAAGRSQLQLYDWYLDEFSDVPHVIRSTFYEQDYSKLYMKQTTTAIAGQAVV